MILRCWGVNPFVLVQLSPVYICCRAARILPCFEDTATYPITSCEKTGGGRKKKDSKRETAMVSVIPFQKMHSHVLTGAMMGKLNESELPRALQQMLMF